MAKKRPEEQAREDQKFEELKTQRFLSLGKAHGKASPYGRNLGAQKLFINAEIERLCELLTGPPFSKRRLLNALVVDCGIPPLELLSMSSEQIIAALRLQISERSKHDARQTSPDKKRVMRRSKHDTLREFLTSWWSMNKDVATTKDKYIQAMTAALREERFKDYRKSHGLSTEMGRKRARQLVYDLLHPRRKKKE